MRWQSSGEYARRNCPGSRFGDVRNARPRGNELTSAPLTKSWPSGSVEAEHAQAQAAADAQWQRLLDNDSETVMAALEGAFEDNQSPAACLDVDVEDGIHFATVLALFGPGTMVPEQKPALTPAGRPTLKKRTKTDRNQLYTTALGSMVLATVKEGFAVAPNVDEIRILVIRKDPQASTPTEYLTPIYAARFARGRTVNIPWTAIDPAETLLRADDAMLVRRGSTKEVAPLDLSKDPELASLVEQLRTQLQ